ncbi:hypothetical protein DLAC_00400 [Tieghemostelium lacteum]|uniref:Uncharacterized protein n=1 Tax=Tieghemostelium lacteum TaxID=361077 RepID=A0A152A9M2_TIELA|nr:hypothetical protein DLAC_00400 [Tieghemostelium lacteum]|eukprot:KYR02920.1 hypothetical protein DLAC_00400 [Tieghemostelium lacteum]
MNCVKSYFTPKQKLDIQFNNNNGVIPLIPLKMIVEYLWFGNKFTRDDDTSEKVQWKFNLLLVSRNFYHVISEHLEHNIKAPPTMTLSAKSIYQYFTSMIQSNSILNTVKSLDCAGYSLVNLVELVKKGYQNRTAEELNQIFFGSLKTLSINQSLNQTVFIELDEKMINDIYDCVCSTVESITFKPYFMYNDYLKPLHAKQSHFTHLTTLKFISVRIDPDFIVTICSLTKLKTLVFRAISIQNPPDMLILLKEFKNLVNLEVLTIRSDSYQLANLMFSPEELCNAMFKDGNGISDLFHLHTFQFFLPLENSSEGSLMALEKHLIEYLSFNSNLKYLGYHCGKPLDEHFAKYLLQVNQSLKKLKVYLPKTHIPKITNESLESLTCSLSCYSNDPTEEVIDALNTALKGSKINSIKFFHQFPADIYNVLNSLPHLKTLRMGLRPIRNVKSQPSISHIIRNCKNLEYLKLRVESTIFNLEYIMELFENGLTKLPKIKCMEIASTTDFITKAQVETIIHQYNSTFFIWYDPIEHALKLISRY